MTTDNESRPIEELIHLDTYQGMTDAEIDKIIEYHSNIAYSKGNGDAISSQAFIDLQRHKAFAEETNNIARNVLQSIERASEILLNGVDS